jgi:hypothetical protein
VWWCRVCVQEGASHRKPCALSGGGARVCPPSTPHQLACICEHACKAPSLPLCSSCSCGETRGEGEVQ